MRRPGRRLALIVAALAATLLGGVQGLYGRVPVSAFMPGEVAASQWLYSHVARGSLIVLPVDDFPVLETADYDAYDLEVLPADPQNRESWMNEADIDAVERWVARFHDGSTYVVFSRTMHGYAEFFGAPKGYDELAAGVRSRLGWTVVFQNADTTIYRVTLG